MHNDSSRRRVLTEAERARLNSLRGQIRAELPDLVVRNQLRADARDEPTLSGALRKAVHENRRPLHLIARDAGIEPTLLDEFLTGERNLLSDAMNRLAMAVGMVVNGPVTGSLLAGQTPPATTSQLTPGS